MCAFVYALVSLTCQHKENQDTQTIAFSDQVFTLLSTFISEMLCGSDSNIQMMLTSLAFNCMMEFNVC